MTYAFALNEHRFSACILLWMSSALTHRLHCLHVWESFCNGSRSSECAGGADCVSVETTFSCTYTIDSNWTMIALRWQRQVTDHLEWLRFCQSTWPFKRLWDRLWITRKSTNCGSHMKYIAESEYKSLKLKYSPFWLLILLKLKNKRRK